MIIEMIKSAGIKLFTKDRFCGEDISIIPKLQSKSVSANGTVTPDNGYVGLASVTVKVTTEGGGTCSGEHVIPVDELPTENIDTNAVYLCGGAYYKCANEFSDVYMTFDGVTISSLKEESAEAEVNFSTNVIPTKTTDGILESNGDTEFHFYYIVDKKGVFSYESGQWVSLSEDDQFYIVSDVSEITDAGAYAVVNVGWTKYIAPRGTLTITEAGTYDVSSYASLMVDIPTVPVYDGSFTKGVL